MYKEKVNEIAKTGIGSKYYRYLDEQSEPEIVRIYSTNLNKNEVKYYDTNWNKHSMYVKDFLETYRRLKQDGIIGISSVKVDKSDDVIIALGIPNKGDTKLPYVVCRQCVYDFFTNNARKTDDIVYVGVSVSQETCPANIDFGLMLSCNEMNFTSWVNVYLDDTIDDIMRITRTKRYDDVLRNIASISPMVNNTKASGYQTSVRDLLVNNNFMYDFHKAFDVIEVPSHIDEETEGLDLVNILYLENELKVNIMETYVIPYTREIDLRTIKRKYVLVTSAADKFDKVYIVGYDVPDGEYVPRGMV